MCESNLVLPTLNPDLYVCVFMCHALSYICSWRGSSPSLVSRLFAITHFFHSSLGISLLLQNKIRQSIKQTKIENFVYFIKFINLFKGHQHRCFEMLYLSICSNLLLDPWVTFLVFPCGTGMLLVKCIYSYLCHIGSYIFRPCGYVQAQNFYIFSGNCSFVIM